MQKLKEKIINILTETQKNEISKLSGIGMDSHFLGGPQLSKVLKDGVDIGWGQSLYKNTPVLQTSTDLSNWEKIINSYCPDVFIEMGVANGGNIIYINDLLLKLGKTSVIYGVDIEDRINTSCKEINNFHFICDSTLSEIVISKISSLINENKNKKILIHFDDCHLSDHVIQELKIYSKFLKKGDVIIVGDTWDEGWYDSPFNALLNFLVSDDSMEIDVELHRKMEMPCNWIFGILIKK